MEKEQLKTERRKLHQIYVDHDVKAFREFIKGLAPTRVELAPFVDESEKVLSMLMHNMKSQLMYLGPVWQESRNVMKYELNWEGSGKDINTMQKCVSCKRFREGPATPDVLGSDPCMHLGASPMDIICRVYEPIAPV